MVYTEQALESLKEALSIIKDKVTPDKLKFIRKRILDKAETLLSIPKRGQ